MTKVEISYLKSKKSLLYLIFMKKIPNNQKTTHQNRSHLIKNGCLVPLSKPQVKKLPVVDELLSSSE